MSTAWKPLGHETYRFDAFRIDPAKRGLYHGESVVAVPPRVFDVILYFVEHSGKIVSKDELAQYIWGELAVADDNISQHIFLARKALGDQERPHRYIVTVHGAGFRFVPEVTTSSGYIRAALGHDFEELERYTAQHLYRSGRHFLAMRTEASNSSALDFFKRAVETKPDTAEAHAGMAEAYLLRAMSFYGEPAEDFREAARSAAQAVQTDPECADAYIVQAGVRFFSDFDTTAALRCLDKAAELDAVSPLVHVLRVQITSARAEHERATLFALEGMRRYPGSAEIAAQLGFALYHARDFETAIKHLITVLSLDPSVSLGRYYLGLSYLRVGNIEDARRYIARAAQPELTIAPRCLWSVQQPAMAALCLVEARLGDPQRAAELAEWLQNAPIMGARSRYAKAVCNLAMNALEECCASLADAIARRDPWVAFLSVDPIFDELGDDRAFRSAVQAVLIPRRATAQ